jgi:hypothetical protein
LTVEEYMALAESLMPVIATELRQVTERIKSGKYDNTDAEIKSWAAGADHLVQVSRENQITGVVPEFLSRVLNGAISAGHAEHDIAAVIETLRVTASD